MIKNIFNKLCGIRQIEINDETKNLLIDTIQMFMKLNRHNVYCYISNNLTYEKYSNNAKKNWHKMLCSVFTKKVLKHEHVDINKLIDSDIFEEYYGDLLHEIRDKVYRLCKVNLGVTELNFYYGNIGKFYSYVIKQKERNFKEINEIEKYGINIIANELKKIIEKVILEKISKEYWESIRNNW